MSRELKFRVWDNATRGYSKNTMHMNGGGVYSPDGHGDRYVFEQFTGLQDKSGVDIYEGDIVECPWPREVFWDECSWAVKRGVCFTSDAAMHSKVIGNIHQHPELLQS